MEEISKEKEKVKKKYKWGSIRYKQATIYTAPKSKIESGALNARSPHGATNFVAKAPVTTAMTTVGLITTWEVHHLSTVTYPEAQILTKLMNGPKPRPTLRIIPSLMSKCSPYSIAKRRVPELIPVLGSQPAYDVKNPAVGCLYFPPGRSYPRNP